MKVSARPAAQSSFQRFGRKIPARYYPFLCDEHRAFAYCKHSPTEEDWEFIKRNHKGNKIPFYDVQSASERHMHTSRSPAAGSPKKIKLDTDNEKPIADAIPNFSDANSSFTLANSAAFSTTDPGHEDVETKPTEARSDPAGADPNMQADVSQFVGTFDAMQGEGGFDNDFFFGLNSLPAVDVYTLTGMPEGGTFGQLEGGDSSRGGGTLEEILGLEDTTTALSHAQPTFMWIIADPSVVSGGPEAPPQVAAGTSGGAENVTGIVSGSVSERVAPPIVGGVQDDVSRKLDALTQLVSAKFEEQKRLIEEGHRDGKSLLETITELHSSVSKLSNDSKHSFTYSTAEHMLATQPLLGPSLGPSLGSSSSSPPAGPSSRNKRKRSTSTQPTANDSRTDCASPLAPPSSFLSHQYISGTTKCTAKDVAEFFRCLVSDKQLNARAGEKTPLKPPLFHLFQAYMHKLKAVLGPNQSRNFIKAFLIDAKKAENREELARYVETYDHPVFCGQGAPKPTHIAGWVLEGGS